MLSIAQSLLLQVMSRDDPCYERSSTNPFASHQQFRNGIKLLGTSLDFACELPSPLTPFTPPSTPSNSQDSRCQRVRRDSLDGLEIRKCQSLPSSPVLLRRAAEKLHQESLHGSARYCSQKQQTNRAATRMRSKSTVFSDAAAAKLQAELCGLIGMQQFTSMCISESKQEDFYKNPDPADDISSDCNANSLPSVNMSAVSNPSFRTTVSVDGPFSERYNCMLPPLSTATFVRKHRSCKQKHPSFDTNTSCPLSLIHTNGHLDKESSNCFNMLVSNGNIVEDLKTKYSSQREASPASVRSSCESYMSVDEQYTSPPSSLSSLSEVN